MLCFSLSASAAPSLWHRLATSRLMRRFCFPGAKERFCVHFATTLHKSPGRICSFLRNATLLRLFCDTSLVQSAPQTEEDTMAMLISGRSALRHIRNERSQRAFPPRTNLRSMPNRFSPPTVSQIDAAQKLLGCRNQPVHCIFPAARIDVSTPMSSATSNRPRLPEARSSTTMPSCAFPRPRPSSSKSTTPHLTSRPSPWASNFAEPTFA